MRWTKWAKRALVSALMLALVALHPAARSADDKRLTVFAPQANYSVALTEHDGHAYVSLNELVAPLGTIEIRLESTVLRLRAGQLEAELRDGKSKVKIGRGE